MTRLIKKKIVFSLQRRLIESSIQNSSGVHWCGHRVRFNEIINMFRIKLNKIPQNFRRRIRETLVQSQVMFNGNPEKLSEKNPRLDTKPSQVQQGSGEGSRKGSGKDYGSV